MTTIDSTISIGIPSRNFDILGTKNGLFFVTWTTTRASRSVPSTATPATTSNANSLLDCLEIASKAARLVAKVSCGCREICKSDISSVGTYRLLVVVKSISLRTKVMSAAMRSHTNAGHGFFYYHTPGYRQEQAVDGWNRIWSFLDRNLGTSSA